MAPNVEINQNIFDVYSGFNPLSQKLLTYWGDRIAKVENPETSNNVIELLNAQLQLGNVILFFDHHYAFDALPIGLLLGNYLSNLKSVLIPYAVHLNMGVGREGQPSGRYWFRTSLFRWFTKHISKGDLEIKFLPVAREFELETPRLRQIVEEKHQGTNIRYLRTFIRTFSENLTGRICFLTPFSGIAFPGKPVLHPQLFRSIEIVRAKVTGDVSFFFTGAYPSWRAYQSYTAPLLTKHKIVLLGPFSLPTGDYDLACHFLSKKLIKLRKDADFTLPDYTRIQMK